jgi:hypothetical protein
MEENLIADDPSHPIPSVDSLDVHAIWEDGRSVLSIIIAAPMEIERRSQHRLMLKLENYLRFINSESYSVEFGVPTVTNTLIQVCLHPDMDKRVEELLRQCEPGVERSNSSLRIQYFNHDLSLPKTHRA